MSRGTGFTYAENGVNGLSIQLITDLKKASEKNITFVIIICIKCVDVNLNSYNTCIWNVSIDTICYWGCFLSRCP